MSARSKPSSDTVRKSLFKRSNSMSHIPLRKDSIAGAKPKLAELPKRSRSIPRNTFTTPTLKGSYLSIPSCSAQSSRTRSNQKGSASKPRSPFQGKVITVQKLKDKKWVNEQYEKVRTYLLSIQCDWTCVENLKPISTNIFVYVINLLLQKLDPRVEVDKTNYVQFVQKYMKGFKYPGQISVSLLKTVNTTHSWPHVMALLGWLVELIEYLDSEPQETTVLQEVMKYMEKCYQKSILPDMEDNSQATILKNIESLLGFDEEEYAILYGDLKSLNDRKEKQEIEIRKKEEEYEALKSSVEQKKKEIKEFEEWEANSEKYISEESERLEMERNKLMEEIAEYDKKNENLKDIIAKQKHSISELETKKRTIGELRNSIQEQNAKIEHIKTLKDQKDFDLVAKRRNVEKNFNFVNGILLECSLMDSRFANLEMYDQDFKSETFLESLRENNKLVDKFGEQIINEIQNIRTEDEEVLGQIKIAEDLLIECTRANKKKLEEIQVLQQHNENLKNSLQTMLFEYDLLNKQEICKIEKLKEEAAVESEKENTVNQLKIELQTKTKNFDEFSTKCLNVIKRFTEESYKHFHNIEETQKKLQAAVMAKGEKVQKEKEALLKMIVDATDQLENEEELENSY